MLKIEKFFDDCLNVNDIDQYGFLEKILSLDCLNYIDTIDMVYLDSLLEFMYNYFNKSNIINKSNYFINLIDKVSTIDNNSNVDFI